MNIDTITTQLGGYQPPTAAPQARPAGRSATETQAQSSSQKPSARDAEAKPASVEEISNAVDKLSSFVSALKPELSFTVDQNSGARVVQLIDMQSQEVIRQIPSEEAVQLAQALDKLQGLFVREKA